MNRRDGKDWAEEADLWYTQHPKSDHNNFTIDVFQWLIQFFPNYTTLLFCFGFGPAEPFIKKSGKPLKEGLEPCSGEPVISTLQAETK